MTWTAEDFRKALERVADDPQVSDMIEALAATLDQRCETCRFAAVIRRDINKVFCALEPDLEVSRPLTINGQPFGCWGWQAKDGGTR